MLFDSESHETDEESAFAGSPLGIFAKGYGDKSKKEEKSMVTMVTTETGSQVNVSQMLMDEMIQNFRSEGRL